jgi:hypothetical protein
MTYIKYVIKIYGMFINYFLDLIFVFSKLLKENSFTMCKIFFA